MNCARRGLTAIDYHYSKIMSFISAKTRTLIVDDEPLARSNITVLLREDPQVEIIGECGALIDHEKTAKCALVPQESKEAQETYLIGPEGCQPNTRNKAAKPNIYAKVTCHPCLNHHPTGSWEGDTLPDRAPIQRNPEGLSLSAPRRAVQCS